MIDSMLTELKALNQIETAIIQRLWDNSPEALDLTGVPLNQENIEAAVERLAEQLVSDYPDSNPVLVGLMDGATPFASLLAKALDKRNYLYTYTTMQVSSYGNGLTSGQMSIHFNLKVDVFGRKVIILDDVCDTGHTWLALKKLFKSYLVDDIRLMVLVDKTQVRPEHAEPDYSGFVLSKEAFIIGMGLDYRKGLRNTNSIRAANPASLPSPEEQKKLDRKDELVKKLTSLVEAEIKRKQTEASSAQSA